MKNLIVTFGLILTAQTSFAETYHCQIHDQADEWRVTVNLDDKVASFFDNDQDVEVPLKDVLFLESIPPKTQYTFQGPDVYEGEITIGFIPEELSGYIKIEAGGDEFLSAPLVGCEAAQAD